MKRFFKSSIKFLAYAAFFIAVLVLFVYMTLPIEEARAFLVRKASDEYNADLVFGEEDAVRVCGLACLEAQNVTLTFRPSAEELAAFQEAQRAWKEWKAEEASAKEDADAKADEKADAKAEAKADAKAAAKADPKLAAKAPGTEGGAEGDDAPAAPDGAEAAEDAADAVATTRKSATPAPKAAPPRPVWPAEPIELASLRAELSPMRLARGMLDGRLEAQLLGGTLNAEVSQTAEELKLKGTLADVDVAQLSVLKRLVPLPISGVVSIDLDLTVELDDEKKPRLDLITGTADLHVRGAAVGPGQIESKKLGAFPYFDVPRTRIADLGGRIVFEKRRATFEDFTITGPDIEGDITGFIQLAAELDRWGPRAHLRFKFSDKFLEDHRDVKTAMTSIPYLRNGQKDGYTGFAVTGAFGKLKWSPRKDSPYKSTPRGSRAPTDTGDGEEDEAKDAKSRRPAPVDRRAKSRIDRPAPTVTKAGDLTGGSTAEAADKARKVFDRARPTGGDTDTAARAASRRPFTRPNVVPDLPTDEPEEAEEPEEDVAAPEEPHEVEEKEPEPEEKPEEKPEGDGSEGNGGEAGGDGEGVDTAEEPQ